MEAHEQKGDGEGQVQETTALQSGSKRKEPVAKIKQEPTSPSPPLSFEIPIGHSHEGKLREEDYVKFLEAQGIKIKVEKLSDESEPEQDNQSESESKVEREKENDDEKHEIEQANVQGSKQMESSELKTQDMFRMLIEQMHVNNTNMKEQMQFNNYQMQSSLSNFSEQLNQNTDKLNTRIKENNKALNAKIDKNNIKLMETVTENARIAEQNLKSVTDDMITKINVRFENQNSKIEGIESKFNEQETKLNEHIVQTSDQFQNLEQIVKVQTTDTKEFCGNLEARVEGINEFCSDMNAKLTETSIRQNKVEANLGQMTQELTKNLESVHSKLISEVSHNNSKRIDSFSQKMTERLEQINNRVEDVQLKGPTFTSINTNPPPSLTFSGSKDSNACAFLRDFNDYLLLNNHIPERLKPHIIKGCLTGTAKEWWLSLTEAPKNFEIFKKLFLQRFWNKTVQYDFKKKLLEGRWSKSTKTSMRDFVTSKISLLRLIEPPIPEDEILWYLSRQLPQTTQQNLKSVPNLTLEKFEHLLGEYDTIWETSENVNKSQWKESPPSYNNEHYRGNGRREHQQQQQQSNNRRWNDQSEQQSRQFYRRENEESNQRQQWQQGRLTSRDRQERRERESRGQGPSENA